MISANNSKLLALAENTRGIKRYSDQPLHIKALLKWNTRKEKENNIIAKSKDYALYFNEHLGLFFMTSEELSYIVFNDLTSNEYKAIERSDYACKETKFIAELERLDKLPILQRDIRIKTILSEKSIEITLKRFAVAYDILTACVEENYTDIVYRVSYNEWEPLEAELKRFYIGYEIIDDYDQIKKGEK